MRIRILGSGAGGGFPQWNCNCANCRAVRAGAANFSRRTQSSLAVSANGRDWVLLNASPDLREQIAHAPELSPSSDDPVRASPIKAAVLTNGDVDHVAGLLNLREAQPLSVYGARRVLDVLAGNRIFDVLAKSVVEREELPLRAPVALKGAGVDLGLSVEAFPVPGKIALWLEDAMAADYGSKEGDTLGVKITETASGKSFFYVPGCANIDEDLAGRLRDAELVFFDGTLWHEYEMIEQGLLGKTGSRMGHVNMSGEDGSIKAFSKLNVARKIYVHINNSNPVLDADSKERGEANAAGWEIGEDGMEVAL
ncbi:pyrroloquinoline quinone biosynthesis protein PqqB [Methylocystis heyeri]|uniref:Coenzyme PQQ synthesis protein B n=1 Tax=Methylocystis heyeri TaxID=391905 RepID=A0A6B8KHM0_9HYPH|nr:pyrroloquinoline quinone biosynthesis protein PqqB [Methylocystis heyeri]QGM45970.1 pyrroloquinoline quinone biosynthesis protein PqqB [Methylocystis heyeri]